MHMGGIKYCEQAIEIKGTNDFALTRCCVFSRRLHLEENVKLTSLTTGDGCRTMRFFTGGSRTFFETDEILKRIKLNAAATTKRSLNDIKTEKKR